MWYVLYTFSTSQLDLPYFKCLVAPHGEWLSQWTEQTCRISSPRPSPWQIKTHEPERLSYLPRSNRCVRKHDSKPDLLITDQGHFPLPQERILAWNLIDYLPQISNLSLQFSSRKQFMTGTGAAKTKSYVSESLAVISYRTRARVRRKWIGSKQYFKSSCMFLMS